MQGDSCDYKRNGKHNESKERVNAQGNRSLDLCVRLKSQRRCSSGDAMPYSLSASIFSNPLQQGGSLRAMIANIAELVFWLLQFAMGLDVVQSF